MSLPLVSVWSPAELPSTTPPAAIAGRQETVRLIEKSRRAEERREAKRKQVGGQYKLTAMAVVVVVMAVQVPVLTYRFHMYLGDPRSHPVLV